MEHYNYFDGLINGMFHLVINIEGKLPGTATRGSGLACIFTIVKAKLKYIYQSCQT